MTVRIRIVDVDNLPNLEWAEPGYYVPSFPLSQRTDYPADQYDDDNSSLESTIVVIGSDDDENRSSIGSEDGEYGDEWNSSEHCADAEPVTGLLYPVVVLPVVAMKEATVYSSNESSIVSLGLEAHTITEDDVNAVMDLLGSHPELYILRND